MAEGNGQIRTYEADSMAAALELVRRELGPRAVILGSRQIKRRRRWLGLRSQIFVAVTARPAEADQELTDQRQGAEISQQMLQRLDRIETMLADLARRKKTITPDLPDPLVLLYSELLGSDVCEPLASELTCLLRDRLTNGELLDRNAVVHALGELIADRIAVAGASKYERGQRSVLAFVGPTRQDNRRGEAGGRFPAPTWCQRRAVQSGQLQARRVRAVADVRGDTGGAAARGLRPAPG